MISISEKNWLLFLGAMAVLVFSATYLLVPIIDPDIFWHLKTGEWIWQNQSLPGFDPFSLVPAQGADSRQLFLLTSYWLAQLIYYSVHTAFGWGGIFVLRWVFVAGIIAALLLRKHHSRSVYFVLACSFLWVFLAEHSLDRPQTFSFLFFPVTLLSMEKILDDHGKVWTWGLPTFFLIVLWGNMHGGVILAHVLCFWFLCEAGYRRFTGRQDKHHFNKIIYLTSGFILAVFINPNYENIPFIYRNLLLGEDRFVYAYISEYRSIYQLIKTQQYIFLFYPFLLVMALCCMVTESVKKNLVLAGFSIAFAWFSFTSMRYLPYFAVFVLPAAANLPEKMPKFARISVLVGLFVFVALSSNFTKNLSNFSRISHFGFIDYGYPEGAVKFLREAKLSGNILNDYNWGGYLLWEGPCSKVFVDTRSINLATFKDWVFLSAVVQAEKILDKYDFKYALLPRMTQGQPDRLTDYLMNSPHWKKVYDQENAVILVKAD